jgi:asparagine synthase (glutamine-hydrolysing)
MNLANQQGFKVLLNGQGADEILAGYDRFYGPWLRQQKGIGMVSALGNLLRYQPFSRQTLGKQLAIFLHHNNGSKHPIFSPALINKHPNSLFQRTPDTDLRSCSEHLLTEVGFPVLLHYEDRNTMAFGIEMRTPFLDYRLVAFALGLPDAYKLKGGMRKYLLREAVADVLPEKVKQRHTKLGFATPQNAWMDANALPLIASIRAAAHQYVPVFSADLPAWTEQVLQQKQYPHYAMLWRIFSFVRWLAVFEVQMTK